MSVFIAISVVDTFALENQFRATVSDSLWRHYRIHWSLTHYAAGCKLLNWISVASQICSSYYVLLFTLERYISVRFPLKRAVICTKRRITTAIVSIAVMAFAMTAYEPYYKQLFTKGLISPSLRSFGRSRASLHMLELSANCDCKPYSLPNNNILGC